MKPRRTGSEQNSLVARAGPALRRAAKDAREFARRNGTAICYVVDGKIVTEKPSARGKRR